MSSTDLDKLHMQRALELALRGQGYVEPNPMVGCVIARGEASVGEGWHKKFGGPHAEVEALRCASSSIDGATMYVTLEPCCHVGKTPPCTQAIIESGLKRVVVAQCDPFEKVNRAGIRQLEEHGIEVDVGVLSNEAEKLNAPYLKLVQTGRPWVIAKWAMTLDGKLASRTGDSQWISNEQSREIVHQLRGRVDAVMVGGGTVAADDPLLTARPPGPRVATRIIMDSSVRLSLDSQLGRTARDVPVLVVTRGEVEGSHIQELKQEGCDFYTCEGSEHREQVYQLLLELGRRRMTNVLVEGGGELLGTLLDAGEIDEVHVFIAPKIVGGNDATRIGGFGVERMADALSVDSPSIEVLGNDVYFSGHVSD